MEKIRRVRIALALLALLLAAIAFILAFVFAAQSTPPPENGGDEAGGQTTIVPEEQRVQPEGTVAYVIPRFLMNRSGTTPEEMVEKSPNGQGGYVNADGSVTIYFTPDQVETRLLSSREDLASYIKGAASAGLQATVSEDYTEVVFVITPGTTTYHYTAFIEAAAGWCQVFAGDGSDDFRIDVSWVNADTGEVKAHYNEDDFEGTLDMSWATTGKD